MNVAHFTLMRLDWDTVHRRGEAETYDLYRQMTELAQAAVQRHLVGLDSIHTLVGWAANWDELFHRRWESVRHLWAGGHNVLLCDSDCLLLRRLEFDWSHPTLRLWSPLVHGFDLPGLVEIPRGQFWSVGQAYLPASTPAVVWRIGAEAWQQARLHWGNTVRHDLEQWVWNQMWRGQEVAGVRVEAEPDPRMNWFSDEEPFRVGHPAAADVWFRHFPATRGPAEALAAMRAEVVA